MANKGIVTRPKGYYKNKEEYRCKKCDTLKGGKHGSGCWCNQFGVKRRRYDRPVYKEIE